MTHLETLEIDRIRCDGAGARWRTAERCARESIEALSRAMQVTGWLPPIIVRPLFEGYYELIDGLRRLLEAQASGRTTIEALVLEGDEVLPGLIAYAVHETERPRRAIERARLAALARGDLAARNGDTSQEHIAKLIDCDQSTVSRRLEIADGLPPAVLQAHGLMDSDLADVSQERLARLASRPADEKERALKSLAALKAEGASSRKLGSALPRLLPPDQPQSAPFALTCRGDGRLHLDVRRRSMTAAEAHALVTRLTPFVLDLLERAGIESLEQLRAAAGATDPVPPLRSAARPTSRPQGTTVEGPRPWTPLPAYAARITRRKFLFPQQIHNASAPRALALETPNARRRPFTEHAAHSGGTVAAAAVVTAHGRAARTLAASVMRLVRVLARHLSACARRLGWIRGGSDPS